MAAGLQAQWDAAYGPTPFTTDDSDRAKNDATRFQQRVSMAVSAQAVLVSQEATSHANNANRKALAKDALNNPSKYTAAFAQAMASQGLDQASSDAQIQNAVSVGWDYMAGMA
jgi:hypothetical protein